jgi:hypothetical protein
MNNNSTFTLYTTVSIVPSLFSYFIQDYIQFAAEIDELKPAPGKDQEDIYIVDEVKNRKTRLQNMNDNENYSLF